MTHKSHKHREAAVLAAYDQNNKVVEELELTLEQYYQDINELIDSANYRSSRGIILIEGKLFDTSGQMFQEFANRYTREGEYAGGETIHADGTVTEG